MNLTSQSLKAVAIVVAIVAVVAFSVRLSRSGNNPGAEIRRQEGGAVTVQSSVSHDVSRPRISLSNPGEEEDGMCGEPEQQTPSAPIRPQVITPPPGAAKVEQQSQGDRPGATLVASFDGLGAGFEGPQGTANLRNPSDNSLAVGPNHIMQTVNTRMAIFDKRGKALYGPAPNNTVFKGFGGACEATNNGDTVVRYD